MSNRVDAWDEWYTIVREYQGKRGADDGTERMGELVSRREKGTTVS